MSKIRDSFGIHIKTEKSFLKRVVFVALATTALITSCNKEPEIFHRPEIKLAGSWQFSLDSADTGLSERWYTHSLPDSVTLPGTLDENHKGIPNLNRGETMRLSRELMYAGKAWYKREVNIPEEWNGKTIRFIMERTKPAKVWIDTIFAGSSDNILTAQEYDLSSLLTPGKHNITVLVDNGKGSVPDGITGSHAWTEHTQSNWNGILGKIQLEASNPIHIENVMVYPDPEKKLIRVTVRITAGTEVNEDAFISLVADSWNVRSKEKLPLKKYKAALKTGENVIELTYKMGRNFNAWSEFTPAMYKLTIGLNNPDRIDEMTVDFGMRKFSTLGTQFTINGVKTFLRGKHDACVFPLTGHPPMDVDGWRKVFQTAKMYGINFYRFHSWTPPMAAFEAADMEGIYLQPELPFWGSMRREGNPGLNEFLLKEGDNILRTYGNHPSFVMFALGNELSGDQQVMKEFLDHFRPLASRQLMAYGSNNYLGSKGQAEGEDYYAGCRVGRDTDTTFSTHIRGSFSFADAYDGGYINGRYPSTELNYSGAISKCTVPALGTEVGQYQIYPNYDEIYKYKGVMKPWNFEVFRERLKVNNLSDQAMSFFRASGALSVLCYKEDIEMALRTPGFGGFHLLDLQDFPGQGTALIGILDAFMESKGLITPGKFSQFCNRVVPLFIMKKYCWTNKETLTGNIQVANYSSSAMKSQKVKWELLNATEKAVSSGEVKINLPQGELTDAADLKIDLSAISKPEKLTLNIVLEGTLYKNSYPLWVYPPEPETIIPANVYVADGLDKTSLAKLEEGSSVLFFPRFDEVKDISVGGLFTPDYWNYRMFKGISESNHKPVSPGTMSILTDPLLPLFNDFPTDFYTNWQWWAIVKNSRPFILDNAPKDYFPLVQVVDNVERNHKLGLIFEFSVGKGKLLVCMSNLRAIQDKPEGRQLYSSILKYMSSDKFIPSQSLTQGELVNLFKIKLNTGKITGVKNISYE
jgi:hypothetical protein